MSMIAQSLNTESMSDILQLHEFGKWARNDNNTPKLSMPGWVHEIKTQDRETTLKRYIGDIDDDYAMILDRGIAGLPERNKAIIYLRYVRQFSCRNIAKYLRSSERTVRSDLGNAVSLLYGSLKTP